MKIAVALSGGVDSAVTAALLQAQGHEIFGLTLQFRDEQAIDDARKVAEQLKIPLHVLDRRQVFRCEVEDPFVESYLNAETPIPCVLCNKKLKFGDLIPLAQSYGAEALASGHYARRVETGGTVELHKAADPARDQSYFLFALSLDQISFLRFPLGDIASKAETRRLAADFGLALADKPDSQDICFIPDGDYASFVRSRAQNATRRGEIVDQSGDVLGQHDGLIHFTVGQRKGLNLHNRKGEANDPLFVLRLDAAQNRVVVGPRSALARTSCRLRHVNWIALDWMREGETRVQIKLRSAQKPVGASVAMEQNGTALVMLDEPVYGIAPGQAGVFYHDSRLLGGGWIEPLKVSPETQKT